MWPANIFSLQFSLRGLNSCSPLLHRESLLTLFYGATVLVGQGLLNVEASRSHPDIRRSVGLLLRSDQPNAETST